VVTSHWTTPAESMVIPSWTAPAAVMIRFVFYIGTVYPSHESSHLIN